MTVYVEPDLVDDFPVDLAQKFNVIPIARIEQGLVLATERELTPQEVEELSRDLGHKVDFIPCGIPKLDVLLENLFGKREKQRKIGEILTEEQFLTDEQLLQALEKQRTESKKLGEILLDLGLLSREELRQGLEKQTREGSPSFDPYLFISSKTLELIPEAVARRYEILPLERSENTLLLASARYLDSVAREEIKAITGLTPKALLADGQDLNEAIDSCFRQRRKTKAPEVRLGELLQTEGLLTDEQVRTCLTVQKESKERLGEIIVRLGYASEDGVYQCVAHQLGCEYRNFNVTDINPDLTRLFPQKFAEQHMVVPLNMEPAAGVLEVAMAEPDNLTIRDLLQSIANQHSRELKVVLSSPSNIKKGIAYTYNAIGIIEDQVEMERVSPSPEGGVKDLVLEGDMPEFRRIINQVLYMALVEGVSDIHIENLEQRIRVRFRIDGLLHERKTPITKESVASVISVLKLDAGLDITERRRAQDGVFKMRVDKDRFVDFRITTHATGFGQNTVIRILDPVRNLLPLDKLGMPVKISERCFKLIENPQGLILLVGPTGSGKTTTLYSMLAHLNREEKKIITAEDPVEYTMDGIVQYQVNETIGNTFADYAARFLRKDPDVIFIGEVRDEQTAVACLKAAMTGHLVFSTLHTNDSVGALLRLRSLGVEGPFIADSLLAVISQRLVRRVCIQCREPYQPSSELIDDFYPEGLPDKKFRFIRGGGCSSCGQAGYRGRLGLFELWEIRRELRQLISDGASETEIREASRPNSLTPLLDDALEKVQEGITTLDEVRRVVPLDMIEKYASRSVATFS